MREDRSYKIFVPSQLRWVKLSTQKQRFVGGVVVPQWPDCPSVSVLFCQSAEWRKLGGPRSLCSPSNKALQDVRSV